METTNYFTNKIGFTGWEDCENLLIKKDQFKNYTTEDLEETVNAYINMFNISDKLSMKKAIPSCSKLFSAMKTWMQAGDGVFAMGKKVYKTACWIEVRFYPTGGSSAYPILKGDIEENVNSADITMKLFDLNICR